MNIKMAIGNIFSSNKESESDQLGTFIGVFLPIMTVMFGVILYLRLGWILGNTGLYKMTAVISFSSLITLITVFSLSAVVTNMRIGGGGLYYVISRSFGMEMGSAIGLALYITQVMTIALGTIGFVESFQHFIPFVNPKILGLSVALVLFFVATTSAKAALKAQLVFLILSVLPVLFIIWGRGLPVDYVIPEQSAESFSFWKAFAFFFPAVTGVEAGVALSGNLKNSKRSLPLGCIAAVVIGYVIYLGMTWHFDSHVPRLALINDPLIVFSLTRFPMLISFGIWMTVLSCALGGFLAAPRTLQAIANDGVLPGKIGEGHGSQNNPRVAAIITFSLVAIAIYFGNLNLLISVMSMFILIAYGMLNLATGLEEFIESASWRPKFRVPSYVSLLGAALCLIAMFMIDAGTSFCAVFFVLFIYAVMRRRKLSSDLDDIRNGILMFFSRFAIYRLNYAKPSLRTWRPNFLVFSEEGVDSTPLMQFASSISRTKGFITMASILSEEDTSTERLQGAQLKLRRSLRQKKIQALVEICAAASFGSGIAKLMTSYGLGPITPDTMVLSSHQVENLLNLGEVTSLASSLKRNLLVVRENEESIVERKITQIDIWWDEKDRENNDLMLILAQMLQRNPSWRKAVIYLKSIAKDELARESRLKYLQNFIETSRIDIKPEVFVSSEPVEKQRTLIEHFSSKSNLVLVGLRTIKEDESKEEFHSNFVRLNRSLKDLPLIVFVFNGRSFEFSKIFRAS